MSIPKKNIVENVNALTEADSQKTDSYCKIAGELLAIKDYQRALDCYNQALALREAHPEAHRGRGMALRLLNRLQEALAAFERAIALRAAYSLAHAARKIVLDRLAAFNAHSQGTVRARPEPLSSSSSSSSSRPQTSVQNGFSALTLLVSAAEGSNPRFPLEAEPPALLPGFEDYKMKSVQVKIEPKETAELAGGEPEPSDEFQNKRAKKQKTTEPKSQEKEKEKGKKGPKKK